MNVIGTKLAFSRFSSAIAVMEPFLIPLWNIKTLTLILNPTYTKKRTKLMMELVLNNVSILYLRDKNKKNLY